MTLQQEFLKYFNKAYEDGASREAAYLIAEKKFIKKYNHRKYSGFASFNVAFYQKVKRLVNK